MRHKTPAHDPGVIRNEFSRIVLTDAWSLARHGADRFGGRAAEYRDQAMGMSWRDTKANPRSIATAMLAADFR
ncbi:hypothetical protein [Rhodopila sp.]|uniref:hypothetical protein n=1 Tax=Rhodopila sp. TaxID=2480087 RepID=UPI003D0D4AF0